MEPQPEPRRSQALDTWNYQAAVAAIATITWEETAERPAFEAMQAFGITVQELGLQSSLQVLAHREVLTAISSEELLVGGNPVEHVPVWVVIIAGKRRENGEPVDGALSRTRPGGGAVVQSLVHARTGEILLGTALPVRLA